MGLDPKVIISGCVYEACFRAEEGLPLPPNRLIRRIVRSIMARGQHFYPITICHFVVMSNHIHFLYVVQDPESVPRFFLYVKRELAHSINRLLGRRRRTVWTEDYGPTIILDAAAVMNRIAYFLTNPQKAHLVERIEEFPGLSSWEALLEGEKVYRAKRINRDSLPQLPKKRLSLTRIQSLADSLSTGDPVEYELKITPNAWMQCFNETKDKDPGVVNSGIARQIRDLERSYAAVRSSPVTGAKALVMQRIDTPHSPLKFDRCMPCISTFKELRVAFSRWLHENIASGIGIFLPGGRLLSNITSFFVPTANIYSVGTATPYIT